MDKVMQEVFPRRVRLSLYLLVGLVALVLGVWQAAEGDRIVFILGLATSLQSLLAGVNVPPEGADVILPGGDFD